MNDPLEQEADQVANDVMRMQVADISLPIVRPQISRKCAACEEEKKALQRAPEKPAPSQNLSQEAPAIVHEVLRSPGQPLDTKAREFFEPRFGYDLSRVRIHAGRTAAESARSVGSLAYTTGLNIAFAAGHSRRLIAHELVHVVQQSGRETGLQPCGTDHGHHATERKAESTAQPVIAGERAHVSMKSSASQLQRHKDDIVAYGGGQSSFLFVIQAGRLIYTAPAVSGHPGHGENELSVGPIPAGRYVIHPGITQPTVAEIQQGTCGAAGISAGFQEITSTEPSPCTGAHYCNVPCHTTANPTQMCFTPRDCWGPMRIKIEGTQTLLSPEGKKVTRDGFFIHGGNRADAVTSGCAKTMDNGVFAEIRKLTGVKGAVPFCVGTACPPSVRAVQSTVETISEIAGSVSDAIRKVFPW